MPTITARILQSTGLSANIGALAAQELGITADTERPAIGSTVGGPKYIGTEELLTITTAAPAAVPLLRRSIVTIICDTTTAGNSIALDIQNGAQSIGYRARVCTVGNTQRQAIVTYGAGLVEYIPQGMSQEFVWTGTAWTKTLLSNADRYLLDSLIYLGSGVTPSCNTPVINRAVDVDILEANYPLEVPNLRSQKASFKGVTDFTVTVAGSVVTFPNTPEGIAAVAGIINDATVSAWLNSGQPATVPAADFSTLATQMCLNIAGVDYVISAATLISRQVTVTGSPATGTQTAILYPYRVAGAATTARLKKIAGFVGVVAGEVEGIVINGLRCLDTEQAHWHNLITSDRPSAFMRSGTGGASASLLRNSDVGSGDFWYASTAVTDPAGGTPRTAKNTSPRTIGLNAYQWAGVYKP